MRVILPCCGQSSRYPDQPPKWMLPGVDGQPMLAMAVSQLEATTDQFVVVILAEHDERFDAAAGIRRALDDRVEVVVVEEPTRNQAETVARGLEAINLDEPFLVKDSDNCFALSDLEQPHNYVSVDSLNNHDLINPRNKSYLEVDHVGLVTNIREKEVISDLFSVGGYYFQDPAQFLGYFRDLTASGANSWTRELYLSDIISAMILDGIPFRARTVSAYEDWGTVHEWRRALLSRRTLFVALDGFLFERGSLHFHPRFEDVKPNAEAVRVVHNALHAGLVVTVLSIRPEAHRSITEAQLRDAGLSQLRVVYDCPATSWSLITAPHSTLPLRTGEAIEVDPDDPNAPAKIIER